MMIQKKVLVFDIETTGFDFQKDNILLFSYYSYLYDEQNVLEFNEENKKEIIDLINAHEWFIGYNSNEFDNRFLAAKNIINENKVSYADNGYFFNKLNKCKFNSIDLLNILRKRQTTIKYGGFTSLSLDNVTKELGLPQKISGQEIFDLKIKNLKELTPEQLIQFKEYALNDIIITKALFEYIDNLFSSLKDFMSKEDGDNYKYLTTSPGSMVYYIVCYLAGMKPTFNEFTEEKEYEGGFVAASNIEKAIGKIYCLDFQSAYPHALMMGNLFSYNCSCCKPEEKYSGNEFFKLNGKYCSKKFGKIESIIKNMYNLRKTTKDEKLKYALKIVLNTLYGATGQPVFEKIYNINTVSDCTLITRTMLQYARDEFTKAGYTILYSDTDSVYLKDNFEDESKLLEKKKQIIDFLKQQFFFPQDTFDMGIDAKIKYIQFFKDETNTILKKNYLYLTEDKKLKIKGLPIMKRNCSNLSKSIFEKYIKPKILNENDCKFKYDEILNFIKMELLYNIESAAREYSIGIKYENESSLQAQIFKKYGAGKIKIITLKNYIITDLGKSKKYISLNEFKKLNFKLDSIDIESFLSELNHFILYKPVKILSKGQKTLI